MNSVIKKVLYYLPSAIFNILELLIILLLGTVLKVSTLEIILIFTTFVFIRNILGGQLHYKDWYRCAIMSILIFVSFFIVAKTNIIISLIMTTFSAIILTKKGNIDTKLI